MYRKLITQLRDYFGISRKEARGALVLMLICAVMVWFPFLFRRGVLPLLSAGKPPWNHSQIDSLTAAMNRENAAGSYNKYSKAKRDNRFESPATTKPAVLFAFNPNTATLAELEKLGIPSFLAKRIERFRSKGGQFRKKEDLARIYDFPKSLYSQLENYIQLPTGNQTYAGKQPTDFPGKQPPGEKWQKHEAFDINTADTTQLIRLKGIGSKLSVRILKFRDGLGGFHSVAQYDEIFGLDSLALTELRRYAQVRSPVKKLNINTISAPELGAHPYFRNRKVVSVIVSYRQQHGPFQNPEDLKKTMVVDDALLKKIAPYLAF